MWDNREGKRNPKAPDFKCKDRSCDGVIWPPRTMSAGGPGIASPAAQPASPAAARTSTGARPTEAAGPARAGAAAGPRVDSSGMPLCPVCGGAMWDDRVSKRNPRAPDFKCRNKPRFQGGPGCEGVIWPPRDGDRAPATNTAAAPRARSAAPRPNAPPAPPSGPEREFTDDEVPDFGAEDDDLPF